MATQVQLRRGTTAQHSTFTGAAGEVTVDTDAKTIVVHDGSTAGGFPALSRTSANIVLNGTASFLTSPTERVNVIATSVVETVLLDKTNPSVTFFTGNSSVSGNAIFVNFINMNQVSVGNTTSFVLILTNNTDSPAYVAGANVEGQTGNTIRWLSEAPAEGSANIDLYTFNVLKTDASAYTIFASKSNFN